MKKVLLQLDSDRMVSSFDAIAAFDSGVDHILPYGSVMPEDVRGLVYGAMFTRGIEDLKNSAVFIGGSSVAAGEAMLKAAKSSFFGKIRVSLMLDANGCNTTAAAAVAKIRSRGEVAGKKIVVLAGTGPVGMRAAALLIREGAEVILSSRHLERSQSACASIKERFGVEVSPAEAKDFEATGRILDGAYAVLCCGAAGVRLVPEAIWTAHATLHVLADVNAVPPYGLEGTEATWDGKEKQGKIIFGAIGIGGLKMKVHRASIARLFLQNNLVLDAEEIYATAKELKS
ncbi:MAG: methylenetetrahydromethanopterin dehydrogenase [Deltaproteobacteria bacterium]|nr:methylenetetrahydromethanopterin dehydrogenase [Deltaproteobacteria bacterium]